MSAWLIVFEEVSKVQDLGSDVVIDRPKRCDTATGIGYHFYEKGLKRLAEKTRKNFRVRVKNP